MRFVSPVKNINVFIKLVASLNLLGKVAWVRLDNDHVRFTVVPDQGTQVWAVISIDSIFEEDAYTIQSNAPNNTINLEVPLAPLHRALKSAQHAVHSSIRLTKKDNTPLLSVTVQIQTPLTSFARGASRSLDATKSTQLQGLDEQLFGTTTSGIETASRFGAGGSQHREMTITQDVPVRVLAAAAVEGIHEPHCPDPEVHVLLPSLLQLKSVSERFTKLALASKTRGGSGGTRNQGGGGGSGAGGSGLIGGPKLELAANMHGELRLGIKTDALKIESRWTGLTNPELDPNQVEGGEEGIRQHPSTRMREVEGDEAWAVVRVEGRDWGRVLGVGRIGGRVVACFCHERALILYVYVPNEDGPEESVLTYYVTSYSA